MLGILTLFSFADIGMPVTTVMISPLVGILLSYLEAFFSCFSRSEIRIGDGGSIHPDPLPLWCRLYADPLLPR